METMEPQQKDSPTRTGGAKPSVMERVRTGSVSTRPPRADPSRPTTVARGRVGTNPERAPQSAFPGVQSDGRRAGTSGVDARWPLTLLTLLVAGIVLGARVGAVVASIAFP